MVLSATQSYHKASPFSIIFSTFFSTLFRSKTQYLCGFAGIFQNAVNSIVTRIVGSPRQMPRFFRQQTVYTPTTAQRSVAPFGRPLRGAQGGWVGSLRSRLSETHAFAFRGLIYAETLNAGQPIVSPIGDLFRPFERLFKLRPASPC